MQIAIIAQHNWPVRLHYGTPAHTGDRVIVDLCWALDQLGHEVTLVAPAGSYVPPNGRLLEMPCAFGKYPPSAEECERAALDDDECRATLLRQDIVHDWSATKSITEWMVSEGHRNVIRTMLGGNWTHPTDGLNVVCQSRSMLERGLRGATDYEGSPTPDLAGPPTKPLRDGRYVYDGIDTDYWCPGSDAPYRHYYLWLQRWHPVRGADLAIELARRTGIHLIMAGTDPCEDHPTQAAYCMATQELARDVKNIAFLYLPRGDEAHQDMIRELYRNARAVLYPTQFAEPFGLGQVEALACGTPVIGTNYGSVPEVLQDGVTGVVCENSATAFAHALSRLDAISPANCRREAVRRFDRRVMAQGYLELYREVLGGRGWGA